MVCSYLENLQKEYLEQKISIDKKMSDLQLRLKENIGFLKLLEDNVDVNYESFSPRGMTSKNKQQIEALKKEQKEVLLEIDEIKEEQAIIIQKIDELNSVLKIAKTSESKLKELELNEKEQIHKEIYRLTLLETQEKERQRISREVHDSTAQNLTSLVHKTELCSKLVDMDPIRCKLELMTMSRSLKEIVNDTRQMIYDLRPMTFDDIGLEVTMERALDKLKAESACNVFFKVEGESYDINPVIGITLLRIIQEACNNAIKYAEASVITVKMRYEEGYIVVLIEDDGKGFDVENLDVISRSDNSGFGLSMMKERVYLLSGKINITSEQNDGTRVEVIVPINNKEEK